MKRSVTLLSFLLIATAIPQPAFAAQNLITQGACSSTVKRNTFTTINEQRKALVKLDFSSAIAFSSASFRSSVSLENFSLIIKQGYSFLINSKSLQVNECQQMDQEIRLAVTVTATSNKSYDMIYILQSQLKNQLLAPNKTGYGISSAISSTKQPQA